MHRGEDFRFSPPTEKSHEKMGTHKQVEFDFAGRTYRIRTHLRNSYDIHGFNGMRDEVGIYEDLISGEKIFVAWEKVPVLRFTDVSEEG